MPVTKIGSDVAKSTTNPTQRMRKNGSIGNSGSPVKLLLMC